MDKREFTVIENETKTKKEEQIQKKPVLHTNPIVKKFVEFHQENLGKFTVKDILKK